MNEDITSVKGGQSFLSITRWYGIGSDRNDINFLPLTDNCRFYCLKQVLTRYIAVSTDQQIEFFDVLTLKKVGKFETGGFYQLLLRANPVSMSFEYNEVFLQESCIGFANGAFFKTALICNIDNEGSSVLCKDVEMIEESKRPQLVEQRRLQDANITRLETIMKKD